MSYPSILRTLLCHRDVHLAIQCLYSAIYYSADPVQVVIHEDGSLTSEDRELLSSMLPGSRIIDRQVADTFMEQCLFNYPNAWAFRQSSVWGLKLLDVVLLEPGLCFYLDSDIRFFRPFRGLFVESATLGRSVFLCDTEWQAYSIRPWHLLDERRLSVASGINTGLSFCDPSVYDLEFIDWFLGQLDWRVIPAWTEPTCWAALALRTRGHGVDPAQITNLYPSSEFTEKTVAGHFLSSYRTQWDYLLETPLAGLDKLAEEIRFHELVSLSPIDLAFNQLRRKFQNTLRKKWLLSR